MSRISRKCYASNYFHVMVKGIGFENIFNEKRYKEKYIKTLISTSNSNNARVLAYCIMNNHAHILFYVDDISDLSKIMSSLNTKYAIYYNKTNDRNGYVFRDRYRCENIYTQNYLENCIRYIHKNPVKANMCSREDEYEYSTYNQYANKNGIIDDEVIELAFISVENYMQRLNATITYEDFIEMDNEFGNKKSEDINAVLENLIETRMLDLDNLSDEEIVSIGKEMLKRCDVTKKEVAHKLNVERTKFIRLMKSEVKMHF